jgi:flagellar FliJ protein
MAVAKFHFKLEALLAHRQQVEKEKQRKLAVVQNEVQALTRQLQETHTRIAAENKSLTATHLTGTLDMQYIAHEKRYVGNLQIKIVLGMQKLAAMEKTLATARTELLAAARDRKVIEKLREKQFARWRAEQDRKEAALMDELGTQIALRNAPEPEPELAVDPIQPAEPRQTEVAP